MNRHVPRGRLHIVSSRPEMAKNIKRLEAQRSNLNRVAASKSITDRKTDCLIEEGKLIRASDLLKKSESSFEDDSSLFPPEKTEEQDFLSTQEIKDVLESVS